ncbi:hypothetical protein DRQ50_00015 [bacterium]|nr:MAG: hypothetical protein DRQ50_00015 [bacterium]
MVEVRLNQRTDLTFYYDVLVHSNVKPGLRMKGIHEAFKDDASTEAQRLGLLAGGLAELLCDRYGDTIEPSACARAAVTAHQELLAENPHIGIGDEAPRDADSSIAATLARR